MRTAIVALIALIVITACQPAGQVEYGAPPRLTAGQSAQLSVVGTSGATAMHAGALRTALQERLTVRRVFRQVATDATPTDVIVNVDIVDAVGLEKDGSLLRGLVHRAEIRAEVEVVDAARGASVGRFVAAGRSAAGLAGGSTAEALDTLAEEIVAVLAGGQVAAAE